MHSYLYVHGHVVRLGTVLPRLPNKVMVVLTTLDYAAVGSHKPLVRDTGLLRYFVLGLSSPLGLSMCCVCSKLKLCYTVIGRNTISGCMCVTTVFS